jgi:integrase
VKLFKKQKSQFYWYDFTVRGQRYRGSTNETKASRASKIASLKLAEAIENSDPLPRKSPVLLEFSRRFLQWLDNARLEDMTKIYYRNGWRLLRATAIVGMRLDQVTTDVVETLKFSGAPSHTNRALRTLRRMLHKAEEWKLIRHAPKLKLMKEYGRSLRLDDEAEKKLLAGAAACNWRKGSFQLFRDIVMLMRDTGMRNERELYRMRVENLDWESRVIFVPDSKTEEGRRYIPMSDRVFDLLKARCCDKAGGMGFSVKAGGDRSSYDHGKEFSQSQSQGRTSRGSCFVLRTPRLRYPNFAEDWKSGGGNEDHGTSGREDCYAISTSRARDCASSP